MRNKKEIVEMLARAAPESKKPLEFAAGGSAGVDVTWTPITYEHAKWHPGGISLLVPQLRVTVPVTKGQDAPTFDELMAGIKRGAEKTYDFSFDTGDSQQAYDIFHLSSSQWGASNRVQLSDGSYLGSLGGTAVVSNVPTSTFWQDMGSGIQVGLWVKDISNILGAITQSLKDEVERIYRDLFGDVNDPEERVPALALRRLIGIDEDEALNLFKNMVAIKLAEKLYMPGGDQVHINPDYIRTRSDLTAGELPSAVKEEMEQLYKSLGEAIQDAISSAATSLLSYLKALRDDAFNVLRGKAPSGYLINLSIGDIVRASPEVESQLNSASEQEILQWLKEGKIVVPTAPQAFEPSYSSGALPSTELQVGSGGAQSYEYRSEGGGSYSVRPSLWKEGISQALQAVQQGVDIIAKYGGSMAESTVVPRIEESLPDKEWKTEPISGLVDLPASAEAAGLKLRPGPDQSARGAAVQQRLTYYDVPSIYEGAQLMQKLNWLLNSAPGRSAIAALPGTVGQFLVDLANLLRSGALKFAELSPEEQQSIMAAVDSVYRLATGQV